MQTQAVGQDLLTFLFTDMVGSTRLWERAPESARHALARHDALIRSAVAANGGSVFKTVGDACCCVFTSPENAVRAAIALQRALDREPWPESAGKIRVRAGVHTGPASCQNGDYFGPALNRVARLAAAAHGGQVLISESVANLIGGIIGPEYSLLDLGAHRLKDLAEPLHIFQIVADGVTSDFPPPATLDARPNNLPSQISPFVGRKDELSKLREMVAGSRLVTICGAGGIGKTRLALEFAADTIGQYKDGSWLVRLADVDDAQLVTQMVASALHIDAVPGEPLAQTLTQHLRHRSLFLLLDNAEHVILETSALVRTLLENCAGAVMLVTSREPLHVQGECVLRLGRMISDDATALFARRAGITRSDQYVERICNRLDRLPLAIEIAAGRIGTLTTRQLDERLQSVLPLASKDTSQDQRHRTLRAAIEWSFRLLNPKEQRFLAILGVFEGGFTLEACEAVAWAGEEDDPAFALLDALVEKSFVTAESAGESVRYRLLDALREFAGEKLRSSGDEPMARQSHFQYFKSLAEQWGSWSSQEDEARYLAALANEIPNVRAALDWAFSNENTETACDLLLKVALYWQRRCNVAEARSWLQRACSYENGATVRHAKLLRRASTFATIEDDYPAARELTSQALHMFRELEDRSGVAESLFNLAVIEHRSGSLDDAAPLYSEALAGFEETGHEIGVITALYNLAQVSKHRHELSQARAYLERGMALCARPSHADRLASFWSLQGEVALREGMLDEAADAFHRALEMKRALGDRHDEVEVLSGLAALEIQRGDLNAAMQIARESLRLARDLEVPSLFICCFEVLAVIFLKSGQTESARSVFAYASGMRRDKNYVYSIAGELGADLAALSDVPPAPGLTPERIRNFIDDVIADEAG